MSAIKEYLSISGGSYLRKVLRSAIRTLIKRDKHAQVQYEVCMLGIGVLLVAWMLKNRFQIDPSRLQNAALLSRNLTHLQDDTECAV